MPDTDYSLARIGLFFLCWQVAGQCSLHVLDLLVSCWWPQEAKEIKVKLLALRQEGAAGVGNAAARVENLQRLLRGLFYCLCASVGGLFVCLEFNSWPQDLLHHHSATVRLMFEGAVAHWVVSLYEDYMAGSVMAASHIMMPRADRQAQSDQYWLGLLVHHVCTIGAYMYCLETHTLSGLCVFGLLFEIPVVLLTYREVCICYERELLFPMTAQHTRRFWSCFPSLWHLCRTGPCLLWPLSLVVWRTDLIQLGVQHAIVYNGMAALFSYVNFVLFHQVFPRYKAEDAIRSGLVKLPPSSALPLSASSSSSALPSLEKKEGGGTNIPNWRHYLGEEPSSPHYSEAIPPPSSSSSSSSLRCITVHDLSTHTQPENAWLAIAGTVYDVSGFLQMHPGGAKRLLDQCGGDATTAFAEAGHSSAARAGLRQYAIAKLAPLSHDQPKGGGGEGEQRDDKALTDPFLGDPGALYETLKVYVFLEGDPFLLALLAQLWAFMCLSKFLKSMVAINSLSLTFASTSFMNNLSLSYQASLCILLLGNIMLVPLAILPMNRTSVALSWLEWRTHLSALCLLFLLYAECTAVMVSYAHVSHNTHFYRITLFGTFTVELFLRWGAEAFNRRGAGRVKRWLFLRQPFPAFLFACASVWLDAYSFKMISPTCEGSFFRSACRTEDDKRQTFLCLVFLAVVTGRSVYTRCLGAHISHHGRNSYATTHNICLIAAIYGLAMHYYFFETMEPFLPFQSLSRTMLAIRYGTTFFMMLSLVLSTALVAWSNPQFGLQARSLVLGVGLWVFSPPVAQGRVVCLLLLIGALVNLSEESRVALQKKAPIWVMATKSLEDYTRLYVTAWIYNLLVRPMIFVLSVLSPHGMKYWANNGPVMDLGPDCQYGMAYQVDARKQKEPHVFQLNVGNLHDASDFFTTSTATQKMLTTLQADPDAGEKGFVSDLVVHFTRPGSNGIFSRSFREINLNIWHSAEAARNWYRGDQTHKQLVQQYHGSDMSSFSAMTAALIPAPGRPVQWHNRCRACHRLVEGLDPKVCPSCRAGIEPNTYF